MWPSRCGGVLTFSLCGVPIWSTRAHNGSFSSTVQSNQATPSNVTRLTMAPFLFVLPVNYWQRMSMLSRSLHRSVAMMMMILLPSLCLLFRHPLVAPPGSSPATPFHSMVDSIVARANHQETSSPSTSIIEERVNNNLYALGLHSKRVLPAIGNAPSLLFGSQEVLTDSILILVVA